MNLFSFTSLFKTKQTKLSVPDTILIKRLKKLSSQSDLIVFKDVNIYHHTSTYTVPLMLLDSKRGLYLFETKEWTFDELKNSTIEKAKNQDNSAKTLAFDNTKKIILKKFNELTHTDGIPIFNYLLMENLNKDEYKHLDISFKNLLPLEKVIFSDSSESDIFKKLQDAADAQNNLCDVDNTLTTLLIQYALLDTAGKFYFATEEQMLFLDTYLQSVTHLNGTYSSGKSNLLLLKAIIELLNNPSKKVVIIKPTILACHILKKKLLDIVEHAIIEIDIMDIEILTPVELINRHLTKLHKESVSSIIIDTKLMKKSFSIADIIMCDDSNLYEENFIQYLKHIQKKSHLLLVNPLGDETIHLSKDFRKDNRKVSFHKIHPHAKALHNIASLLKKDALNITVVSNAISAQKLKDDLLGFVTEEPHLLEASVALINQIDSRLLFCGYKDVNELQTNHIILMDLCFSSINEIEYALNLSSHSVNVLYEEDCQEIKDLRNKYDKSSKNSR